MPSSVSRAVAGLLLVGLGITGCADAEPGIDQEVTITPSIDGTASSSAPDAPPSSTAADPATPTADETTSAPTPEGGTATGGAGSEAPDEAAAADDDLTPADDGASVGANARAMLRRDRPELVLEVDVQQGVEVDPDAVAHLVEVLGLVVDKPGGIVQEGGNEFSDTRTTWTADDLRAAAATHRSTATTDERVSVHVLYVAGSHADDSGDQTNAIGLAYSASTVALFPQRWEGVTSLLGSSEAIERAVLVHELGHLLSLVNLGYQSDIDHEDPDHPGHSNNRESVMFHAVETTLIGQVFDGPPPDMFDEADRSDLEGLRTGRL